MDYDVVVVGAGPVGLMLACELGLAGTRVLVLERLTEIDPTIKAGAINVPAMEALYRRGFLPCLAEVQQHRLEQFRAFMSQRVPGTAAGIKPPRVVGHFGAVMLSAELLDTEDPDFTGRGPAADIGSLIPQQELERVLGERTEQLGVEVRRGAAVSDFTADGDVVIVAVGDQRIRAGWLVGCDGGRSLVRKRAGFEFPGTDAEITGHQAMVELDGADRLGAGWNATDQGVYVHGPVPGRILTVQFDSTPVDREAPVTAAELEASLRAVSGVDVKVTAVHTATRFTDNARQASTYRQGRVLLAGDAAHVHSPFGGQGLNLGLGDAMNLGWKLAATVRGQAPAGLLDTYTAERRPIGEWVLDWTRAQVALMRPQPKERALRAVLTDLIQTVSGTTYFAKKISGVWQRHAIEGAGATEGAAELVGASAPDLEFADGSRLGDHLHRGRALLVDLHDSTALRTLGSQWAGQVQVLTTRASEHPALSGLLVRPDGVVAWAGGAGPDHDGARLALGRWFGSGAGQVPVTAGSRTG